MKGIIKFIIGFALLSGIYYLKELVSKGYLMDILTGIFVLGVAYMLFSFVKHITGEPSG